MALQLEPCPFCGGAPEADASQGCRQYGSGKLDRQTSIYCTSCNVVMTLCPADTPHMIKAYRTGGDFAPLEQFLAAWIGHAKWADARNLLRSLEVTT